jgi:hypothetical protein
VPPLSGIRGSDDTSWAELSGGQAVHTITKAMKNLADSYRNIAAGVRAKADTSSDERVRQATLMAAEVWERLATIAEKSVPPPLQTYTRQPHT